MTLTKEVRNTNEDRISRTKYINVKLYEHERDTIDLNAKTAGIKATDFCKKAFKLANQMIERGEIEAFRKL